MSEQSTSPAPLCPHCCAVTVNGKCPDPNCAKHWEPSDKKALTSKEQILTWLRDADMCVKLAACGESKAFVNASRLIGKAREALSGDSSTPETSPDFRGLLEEMWKFWGRPREQEFVDAGVSAAAGMDLYCRVSSALGDPICAKCDRRFSQHKSVISHDFTHRPLNHAASCGTHDGRQCDCVKSAQETSAQLTPATLNTLIAEADKYILPVDVKIGAATFRKGVKVGTMLRGLRTHAEHEIATTYGAENGRADGG